MINDLLSNDYILDCADERFSRIVLDLILVDRLNNLRDKDAYKKLILSPEVTLSIKVKEEFRGWTVIKGRADWVLSFGNSKTKTGSLLIITEAKRIDDDTSIGMPQMLIYMAAI